MKVKVKKTGIGNLKKPPSWARAWGFGAWTKLEGGTELWIVYNIKSGF